MTAPGEPRIKINPSKAERATLLEWLEVTVARTDLDLLGDGKRDPDIMSVIHIKSRDPICDQYGCLRLHRRDLCALADYVAMVLWRPEDSEDGDGNEGVTGVSAPKEEETPAPTHRERENT